MSLTIVLSVQFVIPVLCQSKFHLTDKRTFLFVEKMYKGNGDIYEEAVKGESTRGTSE